MTSIITMTRPYAVSGLGEMSLLRLKIIQGMTRPVQPDRKSTRLNSSHTEIYTLSLHDALPIYDFNHNNDSPLCGVRARRNVSLEIKDYTGYDPPCATRSEEHTSELQSH